jgi:catechol 2,3-dioxygenase-like lactoylglutathione lyase family enzyme
MQLDMLDHVTISVSDVARAVNWYTTSFKCEIVHQDIRHAVLQFANVRVSFVLPNHQQPHLAFQKAEAADFGELVPSLEGGKSTYVSDSIGNIVELVSHDQ